jgi:hypothetical protein
MGEKKDSENQLVEYKMWHENITQLYELFRANSL